MRARSKPAEPVEVEYRQWDGKAYSIYVQPGAVSASDIVAWVNANGGEARYEPGHNRCTGYHSGECNSTRIAVRTVDGWAYAAPGDYIVKGALLCEGCGHPVSRDHNCGCLCWGSDDWRGFSVLTSAEFEQCWDPVQ